VPANTWCVVYNGGEAAQVISADGETVYPREFACARRSEVRELLTEGFLVVIDTDDITDESNPAARMAKQEAVSKNDAIDAEKAKEDEKDLPVEEPQARSASRTSSKAANK